MKTQTKFISLLLCAFILICNLSSCRQTNTVDMQQTVAEISEQTTQNNQSQEQNSYNNSDSDYFEFYLLADEVSYGVRVETKKDLANIEIPSTYSGKAVREIRAMIFKGADSLKSVTIPEGITDIYIYVYSDCSNMKSITLPSSLRNLYLSTLIADTSLKTVYYNGSRIEWNYVNLRTSGWISWYNRPELCCLK